MSGDNLSLEFINTSGERISSWNDSSSNNDRSIFVPIVPNSLLNGSNRQFPLGTRPSLS